MKPEAAAAASTDADAARLRELGYDQELDRGMRIFGNVALGFAATSPVVGLYGVALVGMAVAGPAWVWVLPIALAGQCLLLCVYSELASQYPVAGGAYQWSRRLVGGAYGWFGGWVAICAYAVANTTIAYLAAPWALTLLGIAPTPRAIVLTGMALVVICSLVGALGIDVLGRVVKAGITAEILASVGIGLALLLVFREQDLSIFGETLGAEALSGGSVGAGMLAALAVGGWVFIGFDACVAAAEETEDAARHVPRAVWFALLGVGGLVILNAVAVTLAHPDPAAVVAGGDGDPVTTAVVSSFGSWSSKPFAAIVLTAFVACLGLLLGLDSTAVGSLIAFGTAAIYASFLLTALAALIARLRGTWVPGGAVQLGRAGLVVNVLAVCWLAFETVNIAWPRESLAPPGAPVYQVWAAPIVLAAIAVVGLVYLVIAKPHRRLTA